MDGNLGTTNLILGIMAAVSLLEAVVLVAILMTYRRAMNVMNTLGERYVEPTMLRVNAILDDAKSVSATVKAEADRVDHAIHSTMHRVDDTVERVRGNVRSKTSRIIGFVRGARVALEMMLNSRAA